MKSRLKPIVMLLPLLLATSCATTGGPSFNLISPQEEVRLGKQLSEEIEREQPVLNDPVLENYVTEIGRRLARLSDRPDLPYTFKVIKNEEVNAFALPGGPVYVHTGLLKYAENEAEFASVLGHEIGHVAARHATEQLSTSVGIQVLSEILLGKNPAATTALASNIVTSLGMLKFSRNDEIEADQLGARYMFEAGYNPTAMINFHRRLESLQKTNPSKVLNLLSTHPMSEARIDAVAREIATFPPGRPVSYYEQRYDEIVGSRLR